ncbi:MAG: hypothetical protein WCK81_14940 [Betaproteobacteria bacterium]
MLDVSRSVRVVGSQHQFLLFGEVSPGLGRHAGARHTDAGTVAGVQCAQKVIELFQHRLVLGIELFALQDQLLHPRHGETIAVRDG